MRLRLIVGAQVAILSLLVVLALWYRDTLSERFEPIQRLFPASSESTLSLYSLLAWLLFHDVD